MIAFCLLGCKELPVRSYAYCVVKEVEDRTPRNGYLWVAHCDGSGAVVFHSPVKTGDGVYYTPYYEGDDAVTTHGYIKTIEQVVP